jgi:thiamine pyrophosphokinase
MRIFVPFPAGNSFIPHIALYYNETARKRAIFGGALLGIVFTGGEGPSPAFARRLFTGLGEKPMVAAADSGLAAAEAAGIEPDWITGDMDSLDNTARLARYPPEIVMRHAVDKDYTDTELALALLWAKGCGETWILGGGGGRIDHLFAIRSLFERERFPRRWVTAAEDIYCIEAGSAGAPAGLALNLEAGALVSVFPLGGGPWQARSSGLKWPLDGLDWNRGFFGVSNVAAVSAVSGECRIKAEQVRFMIILPGLQ